MSEFKRLEAEMNTLSSLLKSADATFTSVCEAEKLEERVLSAAATLKKIITRRDSAPDRYGPT